MFMLSLFRNPKGVLNKLDYYRPRFFWQSDGPRRSIGWQNGAYFVLPRVFGGRGLGITNLDAQNICLLSKWLFKLLTKDGTWQ
jgi:hypothetical protein